ncbi:hypothetical protein K8T06_04665 [bacterium]|nr:hypothetical protein [bacterium]
MNNKLRQIIICLLILLPVIWHLTTLGIYARNIPQQDDFDVVLKFLEAAKSAPIKNIFAFHNEHRLAVPRTIIYVAYKTLGSANFILLSYISNMYLILLLMFVYMSFRSMKTSLWLFIPVSFMIFSPLNWQNMIWVTSSLQHFGIISLAIGTFVLFESKYISLQVCSIFLSVAAVFSSMSGLLVPLILFIHSFIKIFTDLNSTRSHSNRLDSTQIKPYIWLVVTAITFIACFTVYFHGYKSPHHHPSLSWSLNHQLETISHFFIHLGGSLKHPLASWIMGIIILLITLFFMYRKIWTISPAGWNTLLFLLGNAVMISLSRAKFSMTQGLSPRYAIYSLMIVVCLYLLSLALTPKTLRHQTTIGSMALLFAGFIVLYSYSPCITSLRNIESKLVRGIHEWSQTGEGLYYPYPHVAGKILDRMVDKKIFIPPIDVHCIKVPIQKSPNPILR